MSIREMMRLQGIGEDQIKNDNSEAEFGKQIGNSMSLNVVERILFAIFSTIGMLPENTCDRWRILTPDELFGRIQPRVWKTLGDSSPANAGASEDLVDSSSSRIPGIPNRFIVDSGASVHIISKKSLTKKERKTIRKSNDPLCVQTANENC